VLARVTVPGRQDALLCGCVVSAVFLRSGVLAFTDGGGSIWSRPGARASVVCSRETGELALSAAAVLQTSYQQRAALLRAAERGRTKLYREQPEGFG
jgi:hypothetical protein